jgi:hypothetical protein
MNEGRKVRIERRKEGWKERKDERKEERKEGRKNMYSRIKLLYFYFNNS